MEKQAIKNAREVTRRQLGSALADKATDDFCLSYSGRSGAVRLAFGLESIAASPEGQRAIIELRDHTGEEPAAATEAIATAMAGTGATEAIASMAAAVAVGRDIGPPERALALLARQAAIRAERDRFYREFGGLRDDVERASATLAPTTAGRPRIGIAAAPVQACWLNRTIRANTQASVLADIAGHEAVVQIDVPRRLERETVDVMIEGAAALRTARQLSGAGVTVGVIDSEVQLGHPALGDRVVHRRNYTQESFGTPDFHGTAVAGIIAGSSPGFTGMAPEALIYNYKILATQSALDGEDFEAALAIQHALEDGVRIVNCSWGAGPARDGSGREARACDAAWQRGLTIVKSAGNNGPGGQTLTTPADAEGVLVVGATDVAGTSVPDYSSRGPTPSGRKRPHLLAPGGEFGAAMDGILLGGGTGDLGEVGTSFAAPHVTGLVALLLEREPQLTPDQARDRIVATCKALAGVDTDTQGSGVVMSAAL
jgi:serine protease AprX